MLRGSSSPINPSFIVFLLIAVRQLTLSYVGAASVGNSESTKRLRGLVSRRESFASRFASQARRTIGRCTVGQVASTFRKESNCVRQSAKGRLNRGAH